MDKDCILKDTDIILTTANKTKIQILGQINIKFFINDLEFSQDVYVVKDISFEILLGNDFLRKYEVMIDYEKGFINFQNCLVKMEQSWLCALEKTQTNKSKVYTMDDVTIAPHERVIIPLRVEEGLKTEGTFQLIERDEILNKKKIHCALRTNKDPAEIVVTNISHLTTTLLQNTNVGVVLRDEEPPNKYKSTEVLQQNEPENHLLTTYSIGGKETGSTTEESKLRKEDSFLNNEIEQPLLDNRGNVIDINPNLTSRELKQAKALISKYIDIFGSCEEDLQVANVQPVSFGIKGNKSINSTPYKLSKMERDELDRQVEELEKAGVIEKTRSEFSSPGFLVKKPGGKFRLVVNYSKLNEEIVVPDRYPLPRVDVIIDTLEGSKYFSSMDVLQSFFLLPLKKECQKYTAFVTHKGIYKWTRLPMGLSVASQCFVRCVNQIFSDLLYHGLVAYLDDFCSYASDFTQALENLEDVFQRMREANFKIKTQKCHFFYNEVSMLGFKISEAGTEPLEDNVQSILDLPTPRTVKHVRSLLGACSYYRMYIKNYSNLTYPLTELIKKENSPKGKIIWGPEHQKAFDELKKALTNPPVLAFFSERKETIVRTDASRKGIGGELLQLQDDGSLRPVAYVSRKVSNTEGRWSISELEILSIVFCCAKWRNMLYGKFFEVHSDHSSLQFYKNIKCISSRLNRLALKLMDYDFQIKFRTGASMRMADLLSRFTTDQEPEIDIVAEEFQINIVRNVNIRQLQLQDRHLNSIRSALLDPETADSKILRESRLYVLQDDCLYYKQYTPWDSKKLLAVPEVLVKDILHACHESLFSGGHKGINKTYDTIKGKYYWKNMSTDIRKYIQSCHQCQLNKPNKQKTAGLLQPIVPPTQPFSEVVIDYLSVSCPSNRKNHILIAMDCTTRYAVVKATVKADAKATAQFVLDVLIPRFGVPTVIRSDRGGHFLADLVKQLYGALGIELKTGTAYHPQSQGLVEKYNSTILTMLKFYVNEFHSDWEKYINVVTFAYNTSIQTSTGFTPFYLLHGFEASQPIDLALLPKQPDHDVLKEISTLHEIREKLPQILKVAQDKQKSYYDLRKREALYKIGDKVLVKAPFTAKKGSWKLAQIYKGPFVITNVLSPLNYELEVRRGGRLVKDVVHVSNLKPYHGREEDRIERGDCVSTD